MVGQLSRSSRKEAEEIPLESVATSGAKFHRGELVKRSKYALLTYEFTVQRGKHRQNPTAVADMRLCRVITLKILTRIQAIRPVLARLDSP